MTNDQILIMHAVFPVLKNCGNSYANAYTEKWLTYAKSIGAYHGAVVGNILTLEAEWQDWLNINGGLPELPYNANYAPNQVSN